ncbi:hypothetical protein LTS08_006083 [Lithohypha guttulata]|uniref:Uncharacterized protein n=1 Tax=Lithohypha guttulata TaxID=1690604 RepID=A0AAN7SW46_9EURO|nr:hypothetical protein LTR51_002914 [Lithohypha guttulata]KAK5083099.1 hypothetical protein LTR05_006981 [Lithohypha guttulata]KAK5098705.1 hypothetical protein LTS08_006083 [Lithohypha guttulata]
MPSHPSEERAPEGLTDKIAQHSSDSNASDHPIHDENKGPIEEAGGPLKSKGPQIPEGKMPEAKSKDELHAKAAELNK